MVFNLSRADDGTLTATMDSPDQGAMGIPVSEVSYTSGVLLLRSAAVQGEFEGQFTEAGLEGHWRQGGGEFALVLERSEPVEAPNRPQEPKPPFPYEAVDVRYPNAEAGIELAGTLTFPSEGGPFPAVILSTGSGPQNRDEELLGHKPFAVIADHLTRQGIAVLRFDDRGVGESTGDHAAANSEDFASDVLAGMRFLQGRSEVDPSKIGVAGHSEGGLIAPLAATMTDELAFLVLLAGPGLTGEEILYLQGALIAKAAGATQEQVDASTEVQRKMFAVVKENDDVDAARSELISVLDEAIANLSEEDKAAAGIGNDAEAWKEAQVNQVNSLWMRFFLTYDPVSSLSQIRIPVLAINGEKDLQVPPKENLEAIGAALEAAGNPDFTVTELPGLNHLFQHSETGAPSEYQRIEETFSPDALEIVSSWILERFGS
jgi:fermentation-respiration switch protein FrsA (DUF1100 family)